MSARFHPTPLTQTAPSLPGTGEVASRSKRIAADLAPAFLAGGEAAHLALERLLGGALCVTTGQQPGLLTGPLFTVYKALTAVALAETLEERFGEPVVPVFWVAGDDHDLAESNHVRYLTRDNDVERVALRERTPEAPLTPLYRETLGSELTAVMAELVAQSPETEFRTEVLSWLERHYRSDATYAEAFAGALAELLGRFGLLVFRPTDEAAKRAMAPVLLDALRHAVPLDHALAARADELRGVNRPAPVPVGDGAALVMMEDRLGRDRLVIDGDGFVTRRSGQQYDWRRLEEIAAHEPERLSPNVLLRPVVEAALLPTVAYVGGPGELAYLPQAAPVYERLGVGPQTPYPRWSGHVVEPRVDKVLAKYGLAIDDLRRPDLESAVVRDEMPESVQAPLVELRAALGREYQRLQDAIRAVDSTLRKPVESTRNAALSGLTDLEKRIVAHLKKQNEIVVQQIGKARNSLFPDSQPQERMFTIAPYLIRHGMGLLDAALGAVREQLHRAHSG